MQKRIIIIGGGFGGLTTAVRLASLHPDKKACAITLIDKSAHHLYFPLIYEVATGRFDTKDENRAAYRHGEHELMKGSAVDFTDLRALLGKRGVDVEDAEVTGLDASGRHLMLADGRRVAFDHLVIAVGGVPNARGIEGLEEHAHMLYSMRGALSIRRHLHELVAKRRRNLIPHIRVIIGGAGATGVEFACELGAYMRKMVREGILRASDYSIEVIEASPRPLNGFHPSFSKWAMKRIEHFGIKLLLDTCIKGAHADHLVLAPRPLRAGESREDLICDFRKEGEKEVTYDLLVWTGGSKANPVLKTMNIPLDSRGRVEVDATLCVKGMDGIWAIGDCAALADPKNGRTVPPLAQAAIAEGKTLAKNLSAACTGASPKAYGFPRMNAIVPLGGGYGIADVYGLRIKGRIVYPLRLAAEARYFFGTLPFRFAWRMFWAAVKAYRNND